MPRFAHAHAQTRAHLHPAGWCTALQQPTCLGPRADGLLARKPCALSAQPVTICTLISSTALVAEARAAASRTPLHPARRCIARAPCNAAELSLVCSYLLPARAGLTGAASAFGSNNATRPARNAPTAIPALSPPPRGGARASLGAAAHISEPAHSSTAPLAAPFRLRSCRRVRGAHTRRASSRAHGMHITPGPRWVWIALLQLPVATGGSQPLGGTCSAPC